MGINGVKEILENRTDYEKIKASIYFNSIDSVISKDMSPEMLDTFISLQKSKVFYEHKLKYGKRLARNKGGLCNHSCDDRCYFSWLPWNKEGTKGVRCHPDGFEYAQKECSSNTAGECDGCI